MAKFTLENVAKMDEADLNELCDFGCFNDAIRGYLVLAMQDAEIDRAKIEQAVNCLQDVFENTSAAEARDAWRKF